MNSSSSLASSSPVNDTAVTVVVLTTLGVVFFILYCTVMTIVLLHRKEFIHSYYTLTFALGVSDLINLFYISYRTLATYYDYLDMDVAVGKYVVILQNTIGWYGSFYLNVTIAINRFVAIAFPSSYKKIFSPLKTRFAVAVCYTLAVLSYMPFCALSSTLCPDYKKNVTRVVVINAAFNAYKTFQVSIIDIACILIVLIYVCSALVSVRSLKSLNVNRTKYVIEVKLLAQGCLCAATMCIVGLQMFLGPTIVGPSVTKIFHTMYTGLNPVIYLLLDANLRKHLRLPVTFWKGESSSIYPSTIHVDARWLQ